MISANSLGSTCSNTNLKSSKDFQNLVDRLFDQKILVVQTNWSGEYQKLNTFFQQVGISHHVFYPYAHQ
jgi:hypothetical protein